MKLPNRNAKANLMLPIFVFCSMIVFLYSCGNGGGGDESSGAGSVSFGLAMEDQGAVQALNSRGADNSESQFQCKTKTYEIAEIEAQVCDENDDVIAKGGPWRCEKRNGTIGDVETGDNRIVKIFAKNSSGIVIFDGNSRRFTVEGGETTNVGTITLKRVEVAPVANDDTADTDEDNSIIINVLDNDEDANGDVLTVFAVSQGRNGTVTKDSTSVTYSPNDNFNGSDSFTYTVSDGVSKDTATVKVTVNPIEDPPTITGQNPLSVREDGTLTITLADLTVEDPDSPYPDVFTLTVGDGADYTHVDNAITPVLNYNGVLAVPVTVNDGFLDSDPFNLTVRVFPDPDAPTINRVVAGVKQVVINWTPADTDAESYNIYWLTSPDVPPVSKTNYTELISGVPATITSYTHTGLDNRTTYYYVVTAENSFYEGEASSEKSATTWYGVSLDGEVDDVGQYTSIAVNDADMPAISYYDASNEILKVARISPGDSVDSVFREIADDGIGEGKDDVGQHTSIVVLSNEGDDFLLISYYDADALSLKMAYSCNFDPNEPSSCLTGYFTYTAYSSSYAGQFSSLSISPSGGGGVSFYDEENKDLIWGGGVPYKNIDNEGDVGKYTSFYRVDSGGSPQNHISYYDETNGDLKYVAFDDNDSSELISGEIIDSTGDVGQYTSIEVDSDGIAHISYYDVTNGDLKYARYIPGEPPDLTIETVDENGDVGQYSSLALDLDDNVYISYYDATTTGALKYATNASGTWSFSTIDSEEGVGRFNSIALESNDNGYPHISYYDDTNGMLKYATLSPEITVENVAPVANAGENSFQFVDFPVTIELDGSGSNDDDSDDLTYSWTFRSIPADSTATLSDPTAVDPSFDADRPGTYWVQLVVNDGTVDSNPDFVSRILRVDPGIIIVP